MKYALWMIPPALTASFGCAAHAPEPLRVRYAEIARGPSARAGQSVVVEFAPGDRLPVALHFTDDAFDLSPATPPLELVAKRHCFVMMGPNRLKTSLDGKDFEQKPKAPGRFRVGLELTRERQQLVVDVTTPKHAAAGE